MKPKYLPVILLAAVAVLLYANTLRNGFVFDDEFIVQKNPLITRLANIPLLFARNYWAATKYEKETLLYRPLVMASFALDHAAWQLRPAGYHATNVLLHALNTVIIYAFSLLLLARFFPGTDRTPVALVGALLFAAHPVHTEAVSGIVGRTELLSTLFFLLSFIAYIRSPERRGAYFLSLLLYLLGLLSKEMAITLPALIVIFDYLSRGPRYCRARLRAYLGFAAAATLYLAIRTLVLGKVAGSEQLWMLSGDGFFTRLFTIIKIIGYYLRLQVLPLGLRPDYENIKTSSFFDPYVVGAVIALSLLAWLIARNRRNKLLVFAGLWFAVTILPVSNIIPIGGFVGERFLYLPSLSFCWLAALLFAGSAKGPKKAYIPAAALLLAFSFLTVSRNRAWHSDYTLWLETVRVDPANYKAHYNLGVIHKEEKKYPEAERFLKRALFLHPASLEACLELATLYFEQGAWDACLETGLRCRGLISFYENRGLSLAKDKASLHHYLALCYSKKGDLIAALGAFEEALQAGPDDHLILYNAALAYLQQKNTARAQEYLARCAALRPDFINASLHLGALSQQEGKHRAAIESYQRVLSFDPGNFSALYNTALAYENIDIARAKEFWNKALLAGRQTKQDNELLRQITDRLAALK